MSGQYRPSGEMDLSFKHLQMMLMRVDLMIHREVRRWQQANRHAADLLRGQYISDDEVEGLLKQPFGSHWRYMAAPITAEETAAYTRTLQKTEAHIQALLDKHPQEMPRLLFLAQRFSFSPFELDVLLIALAPALDLRYERLYGYLLDDATRRRPSVNLALDLLCPPGPERLLMLPYFADDAPLFRYELLRKTAVPGLDSGSLLNQALTPDPALVSWLLGQYQPNKLLGECAQWQQPEITATDKLMAGERLAELAESTAALPLLLFYGPDWTAQTAAARLLAAHWQRPLLTINTADLLKNGVEPQRIIRLALRDGLLTGALLHLQQADGLIADGTLPPALMRELLAYPDTAIFSTRQLWQPRRVPRQRPLLRLHFPLPDYRQRLRLWQHFLPDGDPLLIERLAGQFILSSGQVRDVVMAANDTAVQYGRTRCSDDLFAAARAYSNPRLADLARKITPRYTWEDLVLPPDQVAILREIIATVTGRALVMETWGVGKKLANAGVTVLFAGPPGTGKTMAAEVISAELGLDLYKIDLSGVVSKYIGETEKNLERIFNEAQSSNAILFFDEADAIFGKRSEVKDAHDRYANIEVSYLLQRMEAYDGVTILATNLRANLDEAFTRRLQFAVDFPFPERPDRLRIWQTLFPPELPREEGIDFERLAARFKLAGGNIRNVIVSAAYLAANNGQQVGMTHLLHGVRRELQKMGRLVDKEDLQV